MSMLLRSVGAQIKLSVRPRSLHSQTRAKTELGMILGGAAGEVEARAKVHGGGSGCSRY